MLYKKILECTESKIQRKGERSSASADGNIFKFSLFMISSDTILSLSSIWNMIQIWGSILKCGSELMIGILKGYIVLQSLRAETQTRLLMRQPFIRLMFKHV